jgi:hypothetical protein
MTCTSTKPCEFGAFFMNMRGGRSSS